MSCMCRLRLCSGDDVPGPVDASAAPAAVVQSSHGDLHHFPPAHRVHTFCAHLCRQG